MASHVTNRTTDGHLSRNVLVPQPYSIAWFGDKLHVGEPCNIMIFTTVHVQTNAPNVWATLTLEVSGVAHLLSSTATFAA